MAGASEAKLSELISRIQQRIHWIKTNKMDERSWIDPWSEILEEAEANALQKM